MSASREIDDFASSFRESRGQSYGNYGIDTGKLLEDISRDVQRFNKNVSSLEHKVAMLQDDDTSQAVQEIMQLFKDSAELAKYADSSLKKLSSRGANLNVSERAQYDRLLKAFTSSFTKFKELHEKTVDIEQRKRANPDPVRKAEPQPYYDTDKDSDHRAVKDDEHLLEPSGPQYQHQMYSDVDLPEVEERDRAIHQLESDILGINEIFRDLSTMVHEQGETIDHIEANVELGASRVVEGNKQLQKAIAHKKCSRRLTCCIIIIVSAVIVVVIIVILIILGALNVYTGGNSSSPSGK